MQITQSRLGEAVTINNNAGLLLRNLSHHRTGRLLGFAVKLTNVLSLEYPDERTSSAEEKRKITASMLYATTHPVSKRNMYILQHNLPYLTAVWPPGVPKPKECIPDEFLRIRLVAGARKLYVALEACRRSPPQGCSVLCQALVR